MMRAQPQLDATQPRSIDTDTRDDNTKVRRLPALVLLMLGIVSILFGVMTLTGVHFKRCQYCRSDRSALGIWFGLVYIVAAVFGEYFRKDNKPILYFVALTIFTCVVSVVGIGVASKIITCYDGSVEVSNIILIAVHCLGIATSIAQTKITYKALDRCEKRPSVMHSYAGVATVGSTDNIAAPGEFGNTSNMEEESRQTEKYYMEPIEPLQYYAKSLPPTESFQAPRGINHRDERTKANPSANRSLPEVPGVPSDTQEVST